MKILCYINHFFGQNPHFLGKSSYPPGTDAAEIARKANLRRGYVEQAIEQARKLGDVDVKVCGIEGYSLVPLDITFNEISDKPLWLVYESLNHMRRFVEQYDYFVNLEDDIFIPQDTFEHIVAFDKTALVNEIFLPNRLERSQAGDQYCVDTMAIPGWTQQRKKFDGKDLRVALNAHSGLVILSTEKFRYAMPFLDSSFRKSLLHNELDSAFAYFHSPFALYRSEDMEFHYVIHLDKWFYSPGELMHENPWKYRWRTLKAIDFVPPIIVRGFSFLLKKIIAPSGASK
jgi:hypothetical protein